MDTRNSVKSSDICKIQAVFPHRKEGSKGFILEGVSAFFTKSMMLLLSTGCYFSCYEKNTINII